MLLLYSGQPRMYHLSCSISLGGSNSLLFWDDFPFATHASPTLGSAAHQVRRSRVPPCRWGWGQGTARAISQLPYHRFQSLTQPIASSDRAGGSAQNPCQPGRIILNHNHFSITKKRIVMTTPNAMGIQNAGSPLMSVCKFHN